MAYIYNPYEYTYTSNNLITQQKLRNAYKQVIYFSM